MRQRKDGTLGPLFINAKQRVPVGVWLGAEGHARVGYTYRPGWHALTKPCAPHLSTLGRVWVRVELKDYAIYHRPARQGGVWILANQMKVLEVLE